MKEKGGERRGRKRRGGTLCKHQFCHKSKVVRGD